MQLLYKRFVLYTLKKPRACHGYRVDIYRDGWFSSRATDYYWPSFCETNHSNSPISLQILFFRTFYLLITEYVYCISDINFLFVMS